jgi:hypothetical protein
MASPRVGEAPTQQPMMENNNGPHKILFVLIDGIGDVSVPSLHNRTPLQHAHTPYMDLLASGVSGLSFVVYWYRYSRRHIILSSNARG